MTAETIEVITDPQTDLDRFKQKVRRLAIRVHHDEGWCIDGLNDGLEELGLARYAGKPRLTGTARLTATVAWSRGTRGARPALTVDTVGTYLRATSTDYDVRLDASRVTAFAPDGDGGGTVTVEATFHVRDTRDEQLATGWVRSGLRLEGSLLIRALTVEDITFTGGDQDPDEPDSDDN